MTRRPADDKQAKKPTGREARLAAALRENLRRRKAQERSRKVESKAEPSDNKNA